jgi:mitochondrial fission protein ELM1
MPSRLPEPGDDRAHREGKAAADPRGAASDAPRVWLLLGEKSGDNAQIRTVAEALAWQIESRNVAMREQWRFRKPRVRASLAHIEPGRSDRLEPPWPDLVITMGRRLSMVALWIRKQSAGRSRIVLVGRPRWWSRRYDLVVSSVSYRLRGRRNVVRIDLPLMRVDTEAIAAASERWRARLADLPRPLTAILVGGPTGSVALNASVARKLAARASQLAAESGGSLFVTTSRRTPPEVVEALAESLPRAAILYRWQPDAAENPYLALLGLADRFVVTSDSATMMVEVARLGRPLAIFELPLLRTRIWRAILSARDLRALPRFLIARGLAVRLGEPFAAPLPPPADELPRVTERIRALLDSAGRQPPVAPAQRLAI